jgi:hypothetical protein
MAETIKQSKGRIPLKPVRVSQLADDDVKALFR